MHGSILVKRRLLASDAENTMWQFEIAITLIKLGSNEFALDKYDDALVSLKEGCDRFQALVDRDPLNGVWRSNLIVGLLLLMNVNNLKKDVAAARANAQHGLKGMIEDVDPDKLNEQFMTFIKDLKIKLSEYLASTRPQ